MKRFRIFLAILCVIAGMLTGCAKKDEPEKRLEKAAVSTCSQFLDYVHDGDWKSAEYRIVSPQSVIGFSEGNFEGGIMEAVFKQMEYEISTATTQSDGSITVDLQITTIDMAKLLSSLPDTISSKEEARSEMLALADNADRKTFEVTASLLPDASGGHRLFVDAALANALTGGLYDIYTAMIEEVETND